MMRTQQTVSAPAYPLYQLGAVAPRRPRMRRMSQTVRAHEVPLYQLGFFGDTASQVVGASSKPAGAITTSVAASAGWGSWAGPVGAGVAVAVGLIAGLMAAHSLRAKQAKNENAAMNDGVRGFDQGLKAIQQAFNSGKYTDGSPVDAATAMQAAQMLLQNFWAEVSPVIQPGRNGCNGGMSCPAAGGSNPCSGNIGAACCVGCFDLVPSIMAPDGVLAAIAGQSTSKNGPTSADIYEVFPSKYGGSARAGYTLTFTPPPATPVSTVENTISNAISSITGSATGTGTSGSILPLLILAGLGFAFLR